MNVRSSSEAAREANEAKLERMTEDRLSRLAEELPNLPTLGAKKVEDGDHFSSYHSSCASELARILAEAGEAEAKARRS